MGIEFYSESLQVFMEDMRFVLVNRSVFMVGAVELNNVGSNNMNICF